MSLVGLMLSDLLRINILHPKKMHYASKKNAHYLELIKEMTPADILPGLIPLLEELKVAGIKTERSRLFGRNIQFRTIGRP